MAENRAKRSTSAKKTAKPTVKKVSVSFDKEFYSELESYVTSVGYGVEDYIKKAVKEKLDSDRISSMIDSMSGWKK